MLESSGSSQTRIRSMRDGRNLIKPILTYDGGDKDDADNNEDGKDDVYHYDYDNDDV